MSRPSEAPAAPASRGPVSHPAPLLILAGFAVGMAAHQMAQPAIAMAATIGSVAALVVTTGMMLIARWRRAQARRLEASRAALELASRLHRHVSLIPRPHIKKRSIRRPGFERQYLPVVTSGDYRA